MYTSIELTKKMTSACNIIYDSGSAYNTSLDHNKVLLCQSLTATGAISAGTVNSNGGYYEDNVKILDVVPDADPALDINISLGYNNIPSAATGFGNIAIGFDAEQKITSGSFNTAVGDVALQSITTTSNNTAIGKSVLKLSTGSQNTGVGANVLDAATTPSDNTAVGYNAGTGITTGDKNTIMGSNAYTVGTNGTQNVVIGYGAAQNATPGAQVTSLQNNTILGYNAAPAMSATGASTANDNVIIGSGTCASLTGGSSNIIIGKSAGSILTTGSSNIVIGSSARTAGVSNTGAIVIGASAVGQGSNTTVIQPTSVAETSIPTHLLGMDNSTGQIVKSTSIVPQITFENGVITGAAAGYKMVAFTATPSGATPLTNDDYVGYATFTGIASAAVGTYSAVQTLNCTAISATSHMMVQVISQAVAANAAFIVQNVTPNNGFFTVQFISCGGAATGAGGTVTIFYQVFD